MISRKERKKRKKELGFVGAGLKPALSNSRAEKFAQAAQIFMHSNARARKLRLFRQGRYRLHERLFFFRRYLAFFGEGDADHRAHRAVGRKRR